MFAEGERGVLVPMSVVQQKEPCRGLDEFAKDFARWPVSKEMLGTVLQKKPDSNPSQRNGNPSALMAITY